MKSLLLHIVISSVDACILINALLKYDLRKAMTTYASCGALITKSAILGGFWTPHDGNHYLLQVSDVHSIVHCIDLASANLSDILCLFYSSLSFQERTTRQCRSIFNSTNKSSLTNKFLHFLIAGLSCRLRQDVEANFQKQRSIQLCQCSCGGITRWPIWQQRLEWQLDSWLETQLCSAHAARIPRGCWMWASPLLSFKFSNCLLHHRHQI